MHQNAIVVRLVEPNGNGAAATVAKSRNDEMRFGGADLDVVTEPKNSRQHDKSTRSFAVKFQKD
jgi:hypothetical protein